MKLKPCPFGCDTVYLSIPMDDWERGDRFWYVKCLHCRSCGPRRTSCDESIKAWNTRRKVRKQKSQKEQSI